MKIRHALPEDVRQKVATQLQAVVFDLIDLRLVARQGHWIVIGAAFEPVHEFLDEVVAAYDQAIDSVAERMLAVGIVPQGQVEHLAKEAKLAPLPGEFMQAKKLLHELADRVAEVAGRTREAQEKVGELDPVSEDFLIELLQTLEKQVWMLQAMES